MTVPLTCVQLMFSGTDRKFFVLFKLVPDSSFYFGFNFTLYRP